MTSKEDVIIVDISAVVDEIAIASVLVLVILTCHLLLLL